MYQNKSLMKFFSSPGLCTKEKHIDFDYYITEAQKLVIQDQTLKNST